MKKMNVVKVLSSGLLLGMLAGCMSQNPYPASGVISKDRSTNTPTAPVYVIDAPQSIQFQEGKLGTFQITTLVPSGTPVIAVNGLPTGAKFDPTTDTFSWTPSYNDGHDPSQPNVFEKDYEVEFVLSSSADPLTVYSRDVEVRVMSSPQPMDIALGGTPLELSEGQTLSATFTVKSPEFPQGPFGLRITQLPDGASLTQSNQDPTTFNLSFTPAFNFVTYQDNSDGQGGYEKIIHITATADGPRGQTVQKAWDLIVHDVRQAPAVSVGDKLTFAYEADFSISAEDLNGEAPPTISWDPPAFGTVTIESSKHFLDTKPMAASSSANPVQLAVVHWAGIPAAQFNLPQSLTLHACAQSGSSKDSVCTIKVVNMTFTGKTHSAPTFDRSGWQDGEVKYIRLGSTLTVPMTVTDSDSSNSPSVTVNPVAMQSQVSFANSILSVTPTSTGTKVFELTSVSAFGVQARESFTMKVLPKEWGSVMLLGQSKADPEVQATLPLLGDAQLIGPSELDDHDEFIERKAAFVTTGSVNSGLLPGDLGALLGNLENQLGRVIVSTPLTAKFPRPSLPDDLILAGRFSSLQIPNKPILNAMSVVPVAGYEFTASNKPVKLNQLLTAESTNPMTFAVNPGGACTVVMNLVKATITIPVAVECTVANGNKVLFAGFEWGDMAFDSSDAGLGQTWLTSWLAQSSSPKGE